ncbi:MAG: Na/Pi cotransporter family protein [Lentisphaerae bacterium]|nr:Na/Pi cotransporter family protein [Lentisphaerota bacterium]
MTAQDILLLAFLVLGGLALFVFGMNVMTDGLRRAAGTHLRAVLHRSTRNRFGGLSLGTALGALVQSSAATVMLVGFVNAGLMTLPQTIPAMLGANLGTTLSMQIVSFKLGTYCFVAITVGFILQMAGRNLRTRNIGRALLGFGLLFLGMNTMSDAIRPHREALAPLLARVDGATPLGLMAGIALSTALTAVWQSSGATVGICFALVTAGVFTRFEQVFPIVLGAHIGTCATALLGSIGTGIEARRCAVSHLLFNIFNVALAVVMRHAWFEYIPYLSSDLVRQTAHFHTGVMLVATTAVLPVPWIHTWITRHVLWSRKPAPPPSFLDYELIDRPETAIKAVILELQRVAGVCHESFRMTAQIILMAGKRQNVQAIKLNEKAVNEIKGAIKEYLSLITKRVLSKRQAVLIQHLDRCIIDIERIGDHIDAVCDLSVRRQRTPEAVFDKESLEALFDLYRTANEVLRLVIASLDPKQRKFDDMAREILAARDEYMQRSMDAKEMFTGKIMERLDTPVAGLFFSEYVAEFDRIVRHSKNIALVESMPEFWIKRKRLDRVAPENADIELPDLVDVNDFLDKLQLEDYL